VSPKYSKRKKERDYFHYIIVQTFDVVLHYMMCRIALQEAPQGTKRKSEKVRECLFYKIVQTCDIVLQFMLCSVGLHFTIHLKSPE